MSEELTTKACGIDRELLSGFIDEVLTQGDRQRVRVHLSACVDCRQEVEDLMAIRTAARTTRFLPVDDGQWDETPRGGISRWSRNVGWLLLLVWLLATVGLVVVRPAWSGNRWVEHFLVVGSIVGWGALLLSAGLDRLRARRTDVYRGVRK